VVDVDVVEVVVVVEVDVVVVVVAPTVGGMPVVGVTPIVAVGLPPPDGLVPTGPRLVVDWVVARSVGGGVTTRPATATDGSGIPREVVDAPEPSARVVDRAALSVSTPSSRSATATVPPASTSAAMGSASLAHPGHRS
jgi:hypothetical protein